VLLPHLGWVGFDPTNNLVAHHRHIRTAVGRDYADVPPTHGIFRGKTDSELYVAVHVEASDEPPALDRKLPIPEDWSVLVERAQQPPGGAIPFIDLQQMQQQQLPHLSRNPSQLRQHAAQRNRLRIALPSAKYTSR
jgi:transglutaminase-like putative cysteine protease